MDETFETAPGITFNACLYKLATLADGGVRVSFDIPDTQISEAWKLAPLRGQNLQVGVVSAQMIAERYE